MINMSQLREHIIVPSLSKLRLYSKDAEELLVFTCAVETNGGEFLHQVGGPALGIYQCEPATYHDMWRNYIMARHDITMKLSMNFRVTGWPDENLLVTDLAYATAMARIHYLRVPEPLPSGGDVEGMWKYYKQHYNTPLGSSTKSKSIEAYKRCTKESVLTGL
jgi:hypothetical protein